MPQDEAAAISGEDDPEAAARWALDRPGTATQWCLVKLGAAGALLVTRDGDSPLRHNSLKVGNIFKCHNSLKVGNIFKCHDGHCWLA